MTARFSVSRKKVAPDMPELRGILEQLGGERKSWYFYSKQAGRFYLSRLELSKQERQRLKEEIQDSALPESLPGLDEYAAESLPQPYLM